MKTHTKTLLAALTACTFVTAGSASAVTFTWDGSEGNSLGDNDNWVGGVSPFIGNQIATPNSGDIILFDSNIYSTTPQNIYSFGTNNTWGSLQVVDGTINFQGDNNSYRNRSYSGTDTVVVGDGDLTAAVLNMRLRQLNASNGGGTSGAKTYVINSDGTLRNGQRWSKNTTTAVDWSNGAGTDTVMRLLGGASVIDVELNEVGILDDADDYVSFETLGSTFTFVKGDAAGQFDEETDITDNIGDGKSFRLGGLLNSGNAQLDVTTVSLEVRSGVFQDAWQITANVIPEPGSLALLGLGGILVASRRRRG